MGNLLVQWKKWIKLVTFVPTDLLAFSLLLFPMTGIVTGSRSS
jgi:hypothetical protein